MDRCTSSGAQSRRTSAARLVRAAIVLLAALPWLASAQYLNFLKDSPLAHFKGDDYELMKENALAVLDSPDSQAKKQWSNPQTGSSGSAEVRSQFTATDGALCKRVRIINRAGGFVSAATYAVCKYEERGWLVHPDAEPAQPAPGK